MLELANSGYLEASAGSTASGAGSNTASKIIEIADLMLYIDHPQLRSIKFPIVALNLSYQVDAYPSVEVTITTAPRKESNDSRLEKAFSTLDISTGVLAHIVITLNAINKSSAKGTPSSLDFTLFSGYIQVDSSSFIVNRAAIGASRKLRLICALAAINNLPQGAMTYFGTLTSKDPHSPTNYPEAAMMLANLTAPNLQPEYFDKNPAKYLTDWVNEFYAPIAKSISRKQAKYDISQIHDALNLIPLKPTFSMGKNSTIGTGLTNTIVAGLNSQATANVLLQLYRQFFLAVVPQTISDGKKACKMIPIPANAWDSSVKFTLAPNMYIDEYGGTSYNLNSNIDCWAVSLPPMRPGEGSLKLAVYGPGLTGKGGVAGIVNVSALGDKISKNNDKLPITQTQYISMRTIYLPGWVNWMQDMVPKMVAKPDENKASGTSSVACKQENEVVIDRTEETRERFAKMIAQQQFLAEGRSQIQINATLPIWTWLQLLPYVGRVGAIEVPNSLSGSHDARKLTSEKYYGMLYGLNINIECTNKDFFCRCGMTLSSVRNEAMQNEHKNGGVFYTVTQSQRRSGKTVENDGQEDAHAVATWAKNV